MPEALDIVSYNIHKGLSTYNRRVVLPEIRDALREMGADVVFLQEVQGKHRPSRLRKFGHADIPQTEFIADAQWPYHVYGKNAVYRGGHHGNALLSVFPFKMSENINLSLSPLASRSLLHAVIAYQPERDIH